MITVKGTYNKAKVFTNALEESCRMTLTAFGKFAHEIIREVL